MRRILRLVILIVILSIASSFTSCTLNNSNTTDTDLITITIQSYSQEMTDINKSAYLSRAITLLVARNESIAVLDDQYRNGLLRFTEYDNLARQEYVDYNTAIAALDVEYESKPNAWNPLEATLVIDSETKGEYTIGLDVQFGDGTEGMIIGNPQAAFIGSYTEVVEFRSGKYVKMIIRGRKW